MWILINNKGWDYIINNSGIFLYDEIWVKICYRLEECNKMFDI